MQQELDYLYIGLLIHDTNGLKELSTNETGYRRVEVCPLEWDYTIDNLNLLNAVPLKFNAAKSDWGLVADFGIFDSLTEGNLLCVGELKHLGTILEGSQLEFKIHNLKLAITRIIKTEGWDENLYCS